MGRAKEQVLGKRTCPGNGHARRHCAKMVNQSIYHLVYVLGWAEGSTNSIVFASGTNVLCALIRGHVHSRNLANAI